MSRGGDEEREQMPRPWDRRLLTLLQFFFINQWIKRSTFQYFNAMVLKTSRTTVCAVLIHSDYIYFFVIILFLPKFFIFSYFCLSPCGCKEWRHFKWSCIAFKLARYVLKIASFNFANLQYFNSTFLNLKIVRLVLNAKCQIVVHAVFMSVIVLTVINKI